MSNTKAECNCGGAVFRPGCPVHSYGHKTPSGPEGSLPTEPQTQAVTGATSTAEDKSSGPLLDQPKHSLSPTHTQASRDYEAAVERGKQIMPDQPSGLANEELTARAIVVWLAKQEPEIRKMGFASVALEALESKIARFTQQAVVAGQIKLLEEVQVVSHLPNQMAPGPWVDVRLAELRKQVKSGGARAKAGGE